MSTLSLSRLAAIARRPVAAGALALAALAAVPLSGAGANSDNPSFELVNRSGRAIREVYVSSSSSPSFGRDLLGSQVLPAGSSLLVDHLRRGACVNDIRVVFMDGRRFDRYGVNTCNLVRVVIT
jgi:hypothetical protein